MSGKNSKSKPNKNTGQASFSKNSFTDYQYAHKSGFLSRKKTNRQHADKYTPKNTKQFLRELDDLKAIFLSDFEQMKLDESEDIDFEQQQMLYQYDSNDSSIGESMESDDADLVDRPIVTARL